MDLPSLPRIPLTRPVPADHRVSPFELFFDLVFVFAFTQVTTLMSRGHDALAIVHGLTVLGILWWSWAPYTWLANRTRVDRGLPRLGMALAAVAVFILALAVPDAFTPGTAAALTLVLGYLVVRVIHLGLVGLAAGADRTARRRSLTVFAVSLAPTFALLFAGVWMGGLALTLLWAAAWFVDLALVVITSRGGRIWSLGSVGHFTERYGLVVMLAVGESIVSVGAGLQKVESSPVTLGGAALAVIGSVVVWWTYFDRFSPAAEHALGRRTGADRSAVASRAYLDLHFVIVAGVIVTALGVESVMEKLAHGEELGWFGSLAFCGGLALFLVGTLIVWQQLTGRWLVARGVVAASLVPASAVFATLPAVAALATAIVVGAVLLVAETRSGVLAAPEPAEN